MSVPEEDMMTYQTITPADLAIPLRDLRFSQKVSNRARWWHSGDPVPTAFFNALSCTFPAGEKFFMDSVRFYRRNVGEPLRTQIQGFVAQEAVHSREHHAFNALAADSGYSVETLEGRTKRILDRARRRTQIEQLAATCALEHFTAILAHYLLSTDSRDMDGAPVEAARLWSWHAMEEIEHKAVAFDTFMEVTKDWSRFRRYVLRTRAMFLATLILFYTVGANMRSLYKQDKLRGPGIWMRTLHFLLFKPGPLARIFPNYLSYYKPGFHPWDHDDRELLAKTAAMLERTAEMA
jgi:uncharacterized protein